MSNENDITVEKEIIIPCEEEENKEEKLVEINDETNIKNIDIDKPQESTPKFVEKKAINKLSEDERSLIIANAKSGVDQPYFNVKFFKNGKCQITKKKDIPQTVSSLATKQTIKKPSQSESKVYYTDNQLLFEHIIELNAKVEKLMQKHKKLKRRYQTLQDDLYIEDDNLADPIQINKENTTISDIHSEPNSEQQNNTQIITHMKNPNINRNWRNQIAFL